MRKLEDGTYMYDTDTAWDRVFVTMIGIIFLFILIMYSGHEALEVYQKFGTEAFFYLSDAGSQYILSVLAYTVWFLSLIKFGFRQIRSIWSDKKIHD